MLTCLSLRMAYERILIVHYDSEAVRDGLDHHGVGDFAESTGPRRSQKPASGEGGRGLIGACDPISQHVCTGEMLQEPNFLLRVVFHPEKQKAWLQGQRPRSADQARGGAF
jgi:hypothetical protein